MNNGSSSPVALAQVEKNINKYRRLSTSNPQFQLYLANAEKKYQNLSRKGRLNNIERSVSPGTVQNILSQLESGSPRHFNGGRRGKSNRKTRRGNKTRGRARTARTARKTRARSHTTRKTRASK